MPIKASKLEALFQQFRGDKASAETAWINTAIQISQYANQSKSVAAIKQDFAQGASAPTVTQFDAKTRDMSTLLYAKLLLDNYREGLKDGPEKLLCDEISQTLGDLYESLTKHNSKVGPLLNKTNEWLTSYLTNSPDKEQAQELTKGLFTMFSCLTIMLNNLPWGMKKLAGDLITIAETELPKLMTAIEHQAQILEPQVEQIKRDSANQEPSLIDNFNKRYLDLLSTEGETTKLTTLKDTAAQTTTDMESLIAKRKEKTQLSEDIIQLQALLQAANDNNALTTGRKYFQELIAANEERFNILRKVHPEQTKELEELRTTIKNESGGLKTGALYIGSWLSSPITTIARTVTPNAISNAVSSVVPDTNDSRAKRKLIEMTTSALADMKARLKTRDTEISSLESKLAKGNEKVQKQIEEASPDDLHQVVTISRMTIEMISDYDKVRQPIEALGERLKKIKQLDQLTHDFIEINDNALSKLSDWFSRFGKWFKTQSLSEKIAEARALKQDLAEQQATYTKQFNDQLNKLDKNPEISSPVKTWIKEHINDVAHNPTTPSETAIDHFTAIKAGAKMLHDEALKQKDGEAQTPIEEASQGISARVDNQEEDTHINYDH